MVILGFLDFFFKTAPELWSHEKRIPRPWKHGFRYKDHPYIAIRTEVIKIFDFGPKRRPCWIFRRFGLRIKYIMIDLNSAYL